MKKTNSIMKLGGILFLFVVMLSSCLKEDDTPAPTYNAETEAAMMQSWRKQMKINKVDLDSFMVDNNKVYFVLDTAKVGTGPTVKTGDKLTVKYTGMFLNGAIFDYSNSYKYTHNDTDPNKRMIAGWEAGIEHLNKGASAAFLFPSALAYGTSGSSGGTIPPYTPLIFVIEVIDIN